MADLLSTYPPGVWLVLLAAGVLIGLLAGLWGVGGGVVALGLPALLAGTGLGPWLGAVAPASLLTGLFATAALALALKLGTGDRLVIARRCQAGRLTMCRPPSSARLHPPSASAAGR